MEKRKPTYDLAAIKAAIGTVDTLSITTSALRGATALGFDRAGIAKVVRSTKQVCRAEWPDRPTHHDPRSPPRARQGARRSLRTVGRAGQQ
ncbi:type II toxin-antitoxin system MqsR family toxin [Bradyrhizobium archetypum]|uniref:type II toxin-antitoxin system MqsR family toxin n=1 Tax=Bradyrhizobium archetypum TaxID=2721160 RepID=UPI001F1E1029|nr:type II toxin-antitoxin system MqsR family toxin [Bradyrhizobium archetypum]